MKKYIPLTKEKIEEEVRKAFYPNPENTRNVKLITWQGGYDLFCKALQEQANKMIKK